MEMGERSCLIVFVLLYLSISQVSCGMFDYVCKEDQLFRPYLRIYQGRSGPLLKTLPPGFHLIDQSLKNLYVCINGPAFLYYAKNTTLGIVYEAPQSLVYSHTCEMQNVWPKTPQGKLPRLILSLLAVLLYGNATDYRLPFIQPFTAPYLFKAGEYTEGETPFPAHFQNATSVALIGRTDCKLIKGTSPGIPLVFRHPPDDIPESCETVPTSPDGPPPTCDPPPTSDKKAGISLSSTEVAGSICRLGFRKDILEPGLAVGNTSDALLTKKMKGLVNSEPIGDGSCSPQRPEKAGFDAKHNATQQVLKNITDNDLPKMETWLADYDTKVKATIDTLNAEIKEIESKIAGPPPPAPKVLGKLETKKKSLEEAVALETKKNEDFIILYGKMGTAKDPIPDTSSNGADDAVTAWTELEALETELEKMVAGDPAPPAPGDIDKKKIEVYKAKKKALETAGKAWQELSAYELAVATLSMLVKQVQKSFTGYSPTKPGAKKAKTNKKRVEYTERSEPVEYDLKTGSLGECTSLPVMGGPAGACKKGKPDPEGSCGLFKTALGLESSPWQAGAEWKEDVLKDLGSIFSTACPYFPNRSKFLLRLNRLMGFYLKSPDHFNLAKPAEGTSSACLIIKDWMNGSGIPPLVAPPPPPVDNSTVDPQPPELNLIRRPFWDQINDVLKDCKESKKNTLVFMDRSELYGKWKFVKIEKNGTTSELDIIPLREQAEEESVFNWVIDMVWRVFATVLGVCVVEHEDRIPHVASKFHTLFTEDFLIPLAETWINSKDNVIFQWIIGEFYNGDAEAWAQRCMEASFRRSENLKDFRPPRSLLVNCESEYNYFIEGRLASEGGILPLDREKFHIVHD